MKKQNKKGFTLVELVIVIAVIAILAGVLIGTFATVISRANQNKALQEWKARVDEAYVNYVADNHVQPTSVKIDGKTIQFGGTETTYNEYVLLLNDVYVELDTTYNVYFDWSKEDVYTVSTSKDGFYKANLTVQNKGAAENMQADFVNAKGKWSDMKYTVSTDTTHQYYITNTKTVGTGETIVAAENEYYTLSGTVFTVVAKDTTLTVGSTYYKISTFNGVYNSTTGTWSGSAHTFKPSSDTSTSGDWQ